MVLKSWMKIFVKFRLLIDSYELYTLVGDFNIHIDWVSDMNVTKGALPRTLIDTMNSSGFTQVLKEPTYRTLNGADHFLDLVFVFRSFFCY